LEVVWWEDELHLTRLDDLRYFEIFEKVGHGKETILWMIYL
jgi:hypothetical protein